MRRRGLGRLAGLVTLIWIGARPGVLLPGLLAVSASGCPCDCAGISRQLTVVSATEMSGVDVAGNACGAPSCRWAPNGECRQFAFDLVQAGSCHLTFTALDERQATLDVTVTSVPTGCCGNVLDTGLHVDGQAANSALITFPASGTDGGI